MSELPINCRNYKQSKIICKSCNIGQAELELKQMRGCPKLEAVR